MSSPWKSFWKPPGSWAWAVLAVVHCVDPGAVVLGGAVNFGGHQTSVGRRFLAGVRNEFQRRAYHVVRDTTVIDFASLGGAAGYIGRSWYRPAAASGKLLMPDRAFRDRRR